MKYPDFVAIIFVISVVVCSPLLSANEELPYQVIDGKVDIYTRVGWKVFHLNCYSCHGVDAVGTDIAPSLVDSLKMMSRREFVAKVLSRYRITIEKEGDDATVVREAMQSGELNAARSNTGELVMPAWEESPYVSPHVYDLFAYLKARSDGALGVGEPEVMDDSD